MPIRAGAILRPNGNVTLALNTIVEHRMQEWLRAVGALRGLRIGIDAVDGSSSSASPNNDHILAFDAVPQGPSAASTRRS
jgi:hypothetical protein